MSEWKLVGKLDRRTDFALGKQSPMDSLHDKIRSLTNTKEISNVGVTPCTNEYLKKKLEKYAKKKYPYLAKRGLQTAVGMAMLDASPCDLRDGDYLDFHIYVRNQE